MTTITKERLLKIQHWRETYGADSNVMLPAEEAEELARIALVSLTAEAVAWTDEQELRDVEKGGCGYLFTVKPVTPNADPRRVIKLYVTPPAQVVPKTLPCSVELKPSLIIGKGCKTETLLTALKRRADYYAELEALTPEQRAEHDAGIAEFIESFGNSGQLNSPVTPDCWISCSERMPEDEQEVIVQNKFGYRYVSYFDEHSGLFFNMPGGNQMNCIEHILVTHWMPLPAPPQH
ncbi:DUF551 domain-containing protein [Salmonella enterica]|nr:DUF551 domain-containing protein [Salmonella enterica]ELH8373798.1 DUF551 domain-containing protein [Salmonella enterica]ELL0734094.1 DUF551 domain-containing protein [Salmonella enterica]ELL0755039.1 DUF551 domain-containing protein [Salmonella enterica]ELL0765199.1 DUF551 domain-containing protein [Salmonella enterica]